VKKCPMCGASADENAAICYDCLYSFQLMSCVAMEPARAASASPDLSSDEVGLPAPAFSLPNVQVIVTDPELGERSFGLEAGSLFLGRLPTNDIVLNDRTVSRRHLHIFAEETRLWVEDLEATNRTLLNGSPLRGRSELHLGDTLTVRSATLRVVGTES